MVDRAGLSSPARSITTSSQVKEHHSLITSHGASQPHHKSLALPLGALNSFANLILTHAKHETGSLTELSYIVPIKELASVTNF